MGKRKDLLDEIEREEKRRDGLKKDVHESERRIDDLKLELTGVKNDVIGCAVESWKEVNNYEEAVRSCGFCNHSRIGDGLEWCDLMRSEVMASTCAENCEFVSFEIEDFGICRRFEND